MTETTEKKTENAGRETGTVVTDREAGNAESVPGQGQKIAGNAKGAGRQKRAAAPEDENRLFTGMFLLQALTISVLSRYLSFLPRNANNFCKQFCYFSSGLSSDFQLKIFAFLKFFIEHLIFNLFLI